MTAETEWGQPTSQEERIKALRKGVVRLTEDTAVRIRAIERAGKHIDALNCEITKLTSAVQKLEKALKKSPVDPLP